MDEQQEQELRSALERFIDAVKSPSNEDGSTPSVAQRNHLITVRQERLLELIHEQD